MSKEGLKTRRAPAPLGGSTGSRVRVNIVTEAQSVLPSFTSAFSIESLVERTSAQPRSEALRRRVLPSDTRDFRDVTSSCGGLEDTGGGWTDAVFENPDYTDTVRSTDSTASALRRSISVPPEHTSSRSAEHRRHAREVFEGYFTMLGNGNQNSNSDAAMASDSHSTLPDSHPSLPAEPRTLASDPSLQGDNVESSRLGSGRPHPPLSGESQSLAADPALPELEHSGVPSAAVADPGPWKQKMTDLLENPEYVDSIESTSSGAALLAKSAKSISHPPDARQDSVESGVSERPPVHYVRNLLVMSVAFFFLFASYCSVRNLQSSIVADSTLAFFTLSTVYGSVFLGCLFSTVLVQRLRPKRTMCICMCCFTLFIAANYHPRYYTLVPAAFLVGFSMAVIWTAEATYLTNISVCYAELTGKALQNVVSNFNGIFYGIFGTSQIAGGIISATILYYGVTPDFQPPWPNVRANSSALEENLAGRNTSSMLGTESVEVVPLLNRARSNSSVQHGESVLVAPTVRANSVAGSGQHRKVEPVRQGGQWTVNETWESSAGTSVSIRNPDDLKPRCAASYCNSAQPATQKTPVDPHLLYILLAIYAGLMLVGVLVLSLLLEPLEGAMASAHRSFSHQMAAVLRWFVDWRVLCLSGFALYSLVSLTFMFGEFNKAFVTCPFGVHMVGYCMIVMSAANSVSSYVNGRVQKYTGQLPLFLLVGVIDSTLLVVMLLWKPSRETLPVLFVVVGFWGMAEAIMFTQLISLFAITFKDNKEPAFAGLKMFQSVGGCLNFATAKYMCTRTKVLIVGGLLTWAVAGVVVLEVVTRRRERKALLGQAPTSKSPCNGYGTTETALPTEGQKAKDASESMAV